MSPIVINTIMKIRDIIKEDVDMSWWDELDGQFNPEVLDYKGKQEKRHKLITKDTDGTPVFTKPVRKAQEPFSNQPKPEANKSAGFAGNVDVQVRAGHLSKEEGEDLLDHD